MSIKPTSYIPTGTPEEIKAECLRTGKSLDAMCGKDYPCTSNEFKLIVAGGRDFNDAVLLERVLIALADVDYADMALSIVSGMARGADALGYQFAQANGVKCYEFPADWDTHGKRAGFIRNKQMGDFADGLLAFWDRKSRGTSDMISYMQSLTKPVHIVYY